MESRQIGDGRSFGTIVVTATQIQSSRHAERAMDSRKRVPFCQRGSMMTWLAPLFAILLLLCGSALGSVTASISGTVTDPSGAALVGTMVTATNVETGIAQTLHTNQQGYFTFPSLALGHYDVAVQQSGFRPFRETGVLLDVNSAVTVDVVIQVGDVKEAVTVSSTAAHVETTTTQLGEVISGNEMTSVPLVSRSYTDLLSLQPGVSSAASGIGGGGGGAANTGSNFIAAGFAVTPVSGDLNAGNLSVNGMREANNGFLLNGAIVQEAGFGGTAVIPNLDSIAEFRIITNNFDAEYGNYSGGQINVITKSGSNGFHGSGFDFLRNTSLDAKNFFSLPTDKTPVFRQNQFGGTFGGPIKKNKTFFFVDYQGTRRTKAPTVNYQMPSALNFTGDFSDSTALLTNSVNGPGFAAVLNQRMNLGTPIFDGEPYYFDGCPDQTQCVFPNAQIPTSAWSPVAVNMLNLGLIPQPNAPNNYFETSKYPEKLRDDKGGIRFDQNTRFGTLFAYYFADDYLLNAPFPNGGANVPASSFAYNANTAGRAQMVNLGDTKNFGAYAVNEFRISYVRNTLALTEPQGGVGPSYSLANLGFVTPWSAATGGISPIAPALEGVPYITFNNFTIGVPQVSTRQFNNSLQLLDNFSRVIGTHSLRFGGQFHYDQINERNLAAENGQYGFTGTETGSDFADFLLGAPDSLTQASPQILDSRSKYYALFAQDSWRATSNLVLNYGVRWEASMPWYDTQNKIETIVPGKQSVKFPGAPLGYVVAGDNRFDFVLRVIPGH